jgi:exodeoxyribonuclease-3
MRVMTWNVLFGGENRFDRILERIGSVRPDVLILQECLGWDDRERLGRVAAAMGVPDDPRHAVLGLARPRGSGKRYHVALVSRRPVDHVVMHNDPKVLGHCLLEAAVGDVTLFGAHFDSHDEDLRVVEARYVRSLLDATRGKSLLAGDLNALSRRDPYPPDLAARLAAAGTDKYGHPPRFETIPELEAAGWIDLLYYKKAPARWITASRDRGGVRIDYRTDYVFGSPAMAETLASIEVVDAAGASDHDAVVAQFTLPRGVE